MLLLATRASSMLLGAIALSGPSLAAPVRKQASSIHTAPAKPEKVAIMGKYLRMIRDGTKTVEGRTRTGQFAKVEVGDKFRFYDVHDPSSTVDCTATEIETFKTFRQMLIYFGYKSCVPDQSSLQDAIAVYLSFPGYKEQERDYGVVGVRIKVDSSSEPCQD